MNPVLIIDDDKELCELLSELLGQEGFSVDAVYDGASGVEQATTKDYSLVILDVMLPQRSGFDVLRTIRQSSDVPVLMLTARGEEVDRIVGLEIGADDYLAKPFHPRELVARMRAILRRVHNAGGSAAPEAIAPVVVGDLWLDPGARVVRRDEKEVSLTGTEFSLLEILVRHAGTVVGRNELSQQVLGRRTSSFDRSLDVHVSNLRKKLGLLPGERERIKTVRSTGYLYVKPAT